MKKAWLLLAIVTTALFLANCIACFRVEGMTFFRAFNYIFAWMPLYLAICSWVMWYMSKGNLHFSHGDKVRYVPTHALGDIEHADCENGVVSSMNDKWVFVKYDNAACIMTTGDEPYTAAATDRKDLVKL